MSISGEERSALNTGDEQRETLHRLIDSLSSEDVPTAQRILEALNASADPLLIALANAPFDDEPETDDERQAVAEAERELEAGEGIPHEEAMRRLGLV